MFQVMLKQCEILLVELYRKSHQEVSGRKVPSSNLTYSNFFCIWSSVEKKTPGSNLVNKDFFFKLVENYSVIQYESYLRTKKDNPFFSVENQNSNRPQKQTTFIYSKQFSFEVYNHRWCFHSVREKWHFDANWALRTRPPTSVHWCLIMSNCPYYISVLVYFRIYSKNIRKIKIFEKKNSMRVL